MQAIAQNTYSYAEYRKEVNQLFEQGLSTSGKADEKELEATKMNIARMDRLDKRFELPVSLQEKLSQLNNVKFVVISEGWCGDSAQLVPLINKVAEAGNIVTEIVLRDQNPELMDQYLTDGGRAIPKLIAINTTTGKEVFTWGPRPAAIRKMIEEYKAQNGGIKNKDDFNKNLHTWYAKDKGNAFVTDFEKLLSE